MNSIQRLAVRSLKTLHLLIVLFVIFGFLFSSAKFLLTHLVLLPLLILHWKTNQGVCYLTELEHKIQGAVPIKSDLQGGFTEGLVKRLTGKKPSPKFLQNLIYGFMAISWLISFYKILHLD
jgi:hypothetical protein